MDISEASCHHAIVLSTTTLDSDAWEKLSEQLTAVLIEALLAVGISTSSGHDTRHERRFLDNAKSVLDIQITVLSSSGLDLQQCHVVLSRPGVKALEQNWDVEVVLLPSGLSQGLHTRPGLAVFDMDSTLIQQEVIDELARAVNKYDAVAKITEEAMRGELDFEQSLGKRVALLEGVPTSIWDQLKASTITFTPGAHELVGCLKALGWKTAVLSGGFVPLAQWVKGQLGLDYAYANVLLTNQEGTHLTGKLDPKAPIVHAKRKKQLLQKLAADNDIPSQNVIAIGDGSNDLLMMRVAGLGIAFNAKLSVQERAPMRMNRHSLLDIMYVLGHTEDEVKRLLVI
ncbi:Phosphoserine phosphatase [Recurvomyces mirabilis]|uniref:phosphoserine phosphatase n=1 Tax=Recurvomyces mirabilis TaxID=574656 RepID=A0AAE0WM76_9PEZI|nr:Phosphoserine phosphatase [Recurvomyces mirabilis]KAK5154163.1 Phosphoserine phosphatase [Recurvomyces mirabilis]